MANTAFMQQKFSVDTMIAQYLAEIKALRTANMSPADQTKLQLYYQAASTFHRLSIKDMVQFALSWGRGTSGKVPQMRDAFPMLLGNRVGQPSPIDLAYARLLLAYTEAFYHYRGHLKEWTLRFLLSSRYSPLFQHVDREIQYVIENTRHKIQHYQSRLGG